MKRNFELLIFSGAANSAAAAASNQDAGKLGTSDTASGARQGARWQEREAALRELATTLGLKVHSENSLAEPDESSLACDVEWPIDKIGRDAIIILAGQPTAEKLVSAVEILKGRGHDLVIAVDALRDLRGLLNSLVKLNEQSVQLIVTGAVKELVTSEHLMVYRFPKADSTTTIAVFADIHAGDPLVLTMVRGANPFKGMESFPGGFLNVQLETLPECAARELMEECFVNPNATGEHDRFTYHVKASDMVLIDVRSDPDRDERGHVVDHGYAWFIPKSEQAEVMAKLNAGDDAAAGSARFIRVSELKSRDLAFDHKLFFEAALARLKSLA